jgi:multiple sugar transport system permease protein
MKATDVIKKTGAYIFLILLAFICIIPFYLMIVNATRSNAEIFRGPSVLPGSYTIQNFKTLTLGRQDTNTGLYTGGLNVPRALVNSFYISVTATVLASYFSALTAYGFAMYTFRGSKLLFALMLGVIMIPPAISLIGIFKLILGLGLFDTHAALILPAIASPFTVFFLRQYAKSTIPPSLVEAARIDGAGEFFIFHRIGLPLLIPGVATMAIFGFLFQWNSYVIPLTVLSTNDKFTLPLVIQQLNTTTYNRDLGALYSGIVVSVIPIMIVFAISSRYLVSGITFGAVKE